MCVGRGAVPEEDAVRLDEDVVGAGVRLETRVLSLA